MKSTKIIKKGLASLALASTLSAGAAEKLDRTPHGYHESFFTDSIAQSDVKVFGPITDKVGYFGRSRFTYNLEKKDIGQFSFLDLSYKLGNGVGIFQETQFIDSGDSTKLSPLFGLQLSRNLSNNLGIYLSAGANIPTRVSPKSRGQFIGNVSWTPKISKNLSALVKAETATILGNEGMNFTHQRFRLGLRRGRIEGGVGANLTKVKGSKPNYTIGGFFGWKF